MPQLLGLHAKLVLSGRVTCSSVATVGCCAMPNSVDMHVPSSRHESDFTKLGAMWNRHTEKCQAHAASAAQGGCPPGLPNMMAQLPRSIQAPAAQQPEKARHQPHLIPDVAF